jgi:hypothetical protein
MGWQNPANARARRPEGEQREPPGRWGAQFAARLRRRRSFDDLIRPQQQ